MSHCKVFACQDEYENGFPTHKIVNGLCVKCLITDPGNQICSQTSKCENCNNSNIRESTSQSNYDVKSQHENLQVKIQQLQLEIKILKAKLDKCKCN